MNCPRPSATALVSLPSACEPLPVSQALLLVGHGSTLSAKVSAPVYAHAERIRRGGVFDEVHTAFWKEDPPIHGALERIAAETVFVVPLLMADGYFARLVVPRELGLVHGTNRTCGRTVHYCPPIGAHPGIGRIVLRRAREVAPLGTAERSRAALVLIGHGTRREPRSAGSVHALARALSRAGGYARVEAAFLDEEPRVEDVVARAREPNVVIVPVLAYEGWHTQRTIPASLSLTGSRSERGGSVLWYARAVGTSPEVAQIAIDLAVRAGARPPASRASARTGFTGGAT